MKPQIDVIHGDITTMHVDVIVNAANPSLMGGGGVDGAIHRAAGPQLLEACKIVRQQQGECPPGHAVITLAGNLPARAVIHAVGPVWHELSESVVHYKYSSMKIVLEGQTRFVRANEVSRYGT